ncbi:DNA repair protein XRCC3 homolog [Magnolia sinica]|uniref:DNA repair protein XRCC3 homolog n=1 Tax=Magnolia sinica TaxID=86752 RepID=UPI002659D616|nr:DNA repair protein XRCC3 homolog [Magnolia sinica]
MPPIQPQNPLQLPTLKCTLGCPILDRLLDGGIPTNSITELVSEAGCGKTQLSLQLLLCAQLPLSRGGLSASSLYIHTEFPFPFRRLHQLSLSFRSPDDSSDPCDRIFVHAAHSADDLLALLDRVDALLSNLHSPLPPVKLIVIDSIAALFRSEFENCPSDLKRRSSLFFRIAGKLKVQAERFGLAVVVTNQVMDLVGGDEVNGLKVGNFLELYSSGRRVCPALGISWANCVNSRVFLSRSDEVWNADSGSENQEELGGCVRTRRRMQVVFAPHLPESSCEFVIVREGVFGVG